MGEMEDRLDADTINKLSESAAAGSCDAMVYWGKDDAAIQLL